MTESSAFDSKATARNWVWDRLQSRELARAPLPPHGRIPNFEGAELAALRLFETPLFARARTIKINPDSAQKAVRALALKRGIRIYVPTPQLAGRFHLLDPTRIHESDFEAAASRETMAGFSQPVALGDIPQLDAIVTGSVAVTRDGKRCGKGKGYSDLEFAILKELGHKPVPVATTVHEVQVVDDFPIESVDQPLSLIVTPSQTISVAEPLAGPERVEWERLTSRDIEAMPILEDLRNLQSRAKPC